MYGLQCMYGATSLACAGIGILSPAYLVSVIHQDFELSVVSTLISNKLQLLPADSINYSCTYFEPAIDVTFMSLNSDDRTTAFGTSLRAFAPSLIQDSPLFTTYAHGRCGRRSKASLFASAELIEPIPKSMLRAC